jgi:hypothetical protein
MQQGTLVLSGAFAAATGDERIGCPVTAHHANEVLESEVTPATLYEEALRQPGVSELMKVYLEAQKVQAAAACYLSSPEPRYVAATSSSSTRGILAGCK